MLKGLQFLTPFLKQLFENSFLKTVFENSFLKTASLENSSLNGLPAQLSFYSTVHFCNEIKQQYI